MHLYSKSFLFILCCLLLFAGMLFSCSNRTSSNAQLQRIDSLLEKNPEKALSLLKKIPAPQKFTKADKAYYAILLAAATDKNELSLLPCDSLLNAAIDYYGDNDLGKAIALLYKGRLQAEMNDEKAAIATSLKALDVLQNFPEDTKYRRLLYSSLGLWYGNSRLYYKALEVLKQSLAFTLSAKDSSIAYSNISYVYTMKGKKDSALFYLEQSLKYAKHSNDVKFLTNCLYNASLQYDHFEETDSAINYAKSAISKIDPTNNDYGNFCYNLGDLYLNSGKLDSAQYYLNKSLRLSGLKYMNYWSLSFLEAERSHFPKAYKYLSKFVEIGDSLNNRKQMTEIQHLVYKHQTEMKVKEEQNRYKRVIGYCIFLFITIGFIIILYYQNKVNRKKRKEALYRQSIEHSYEKINAMQQRIDENEKFINVLQFEQNKNAKEINERETLIEQLKEEKFKLQTWLFEQTPIYKRIIELSHQNVSQKRERKVLTSEESEKLKKAVFEIHNQYISLLKTSYPRLTDDDILLICLQKIGFDSQTISLCFGYSDTIAINQRKSRMKGKMSQQENLKS